MSLGENSNKFKIGDRVSGIFTQSWITGEPTQQNWVSTLGSPLNGLLAEFVVLPEEGVVHVPEGALVLGGRMPSIDQFQIHR
ncbi:hypothetical protein AB4Z50_03040 [Paenibacillus sp. 2TAB26]|uniref:alcohol dehydrogenase catalytic domain-containing protein n=1 Tax=Paenibacillus sp. 2TAB26 TaxID=3233005 RepID=UPI003F9A8127